jgi:hypothetical protein
MLNLNPNLNKKPKFLTNLMLKNEIIYIYIYSNQKNKNQEG